MFSVAALNAVQARVTGEVSHLVDNGIMAAFVSFSTGLTILLIICVFSSRVRRAFFSIPSRVRSGQLTWWQCLGGVAGASFMTGQGLAVPVIGVAIFIVATVAGQCVASLFVDRWGLGPSGAKPITLVRVIAALVAIIGVAISATGRATVGHVAIPLILFVFIAGGFTSAQHAFNGRVAVATGQPLGTTVWNFTMGTSTLLIALLVGHFIGGMPLHHPPAPWDRPLLWTAGLIGVTFIVSASVLVRSLGMLVFSLVVVVGQLAGGIALDLLFPTAGSQINHQVLIGMVVTASAIAIALWQSAREIMPINE